MYLTGGATAVLEGWRPSTVDVDVRFEPESEEPLRLIAELKEIRQPPSRGQRRLNLLYGAQVATRPPRFRFTVNDPGLVTRDYGYWVENRLRDRLGLEGVPVVVDFRRRS